MAEAAEWEPARELASDVIDRVESVFQPRRRSNLRMHHEKPAPKMIHTRRRTT